MEKDKEMKKLSDNQKEMLEVLEDTFNFYSKNPNKRGLSSDDSSCLFLTFEGNNCAVGRYLNKKDLKSLETNHKLDDSIRGLIMDKVKLSSTIIKRLPLQFWEDLQNFHDRDNHWKKRWNYL